ncbi:hypothetical protein M8J76_008825 [Diaphorina citri]|nr:hypothetical protein M8J75_011068 [Diaphorina citri]KAI5740947.1 hypothetical protein M8J76_008825 [Diaphorina citri]
MWSASFVFICLLCSTNPILGDYYSSLLNVEKLVEIEDQFIKSIENYIENTEKLLEQCEKALDIWQWNHDKDIADPEEFVELPINEFKLIKRNTVDKELLIEKFFKPLENDILKMTEIMSKLPDETDLYETSLAIAKLSFVYNMTFTSMLVDGEIGFGEAYYYHEPLRSDEIVMFFHQLYSNKYNILHYFYEEFFDIVLNAMKNVSYSSDGRKYYVAVYHFCEMMDNLLKEVSPKKLTNLVLEVGAMFPDEPMLEEKHRLIMSRLETMLYSNASKAQKYQQLCQGKGERSIKLLSTLKCYYLRHGRSLYLLIAPAKVEQLNVDPEILLFHDILTDNQIERITHAAVPHMERSQVQETSSLKDNSEVQFEPEPEVSKIRLTHQADVPANLTKEMHDLQYFTEDVTGLNKAGFEHFSVNIYGVGGYYIYHTDTPPTGEYKRIATMLFYLSDVQLGGATVFPHFNLTVQARKGTAILWYNTHTSGDVDYRMTHSACPVLLGHKWIGTYFIEFWPQMFHRPCRSYEKLTPVNLYLEDYVTIPELQQ